MRAELKMAEKKIEMEKAEKAARSKLPELKITPFNGTPVDWIRFQNMFTSQIHDKSLSDEEKYGYLLELVVPKVRSRLANLKSGALGYLDTGSGRNFISGEAANKLKLNPIRHETRYIVTVNGTKKQSMPIYDVTINSVDNKTNEKIEITGSKLADFTTIKRTTLTELKEKLQHVQGKMF